MRAWRTPRTRYPCRRSWPASPAGSGTAPARRPVQKEAAAVLDLKFVRENPDVVREAVRLKGEPGVDIDGVLSLDERWREHLQRLEALRAERNRVSAEIGRLRKAGEPAEAQIAEMRRVGDEIQALEAEVRTIQEQIQAKLLNVPNLVHPDVPHGVD